MYKVTVYEMQGGFKCRLGVKVFKGVDAQEQAFNHASKFSKKKGPKGKYTCFVESIKEGN